GATIPPGYAATSLGSDCDDNKATVHALQTFYLDADKDGYGNPARTTFVCSSTAPAGYVRDNTDCNDNDKYIHTAKLYYVDADHDGYGAQTKAMLCSSTAPYGYATNNSDCNDNNAAVHP